MEERVYRIWDSALCFRRELRSLHLRDASPRQQRSLPRRVRMAEKFILHVEILFSAIDDLEANFRKEEAKGISHIREARMLCKKIVNFFSLLSHTQETGARRMGITQELLSLVTGLAHYLKILIRIALTGALKLDREFFNEEALHWFLSQLAFSAKLGSITADDKQGTTAPNTNTVGPDGKWYGYRSLPRSTSSGSSDNGEAATDLCVACGSTVEEECMRMGVNLRWHSNCLKCSNCQRPALREGASTRKQPDPVPGAPEAVPASQFGLDSKRKQPAGGAELQNGSRSLSAGSWSHACFCPSCAGGMQLRTGFESVTRLEQYAFLLRVALNRLFALLRKRGVVPPSPPVSASRQIGEGGEASVSGTAASGDAGEELSMHEAYRDSQDIKRMKSVNLNRKLSTKAKVPASPPWLAVRPVDRRRLRICSDHLHPTLGCRPTTGTRLARPVLARRLERPARLSSAKVARLVHRRLPAKHDRRSRHKATSKHLSNSSRYSSQCSSICRSPFHRIQQPPQFGVGSAGRSGSPSNFEPGSIVPIDLPLPATTPMLRFARMDLCDSLLATRRSVRRGARMASRLPISRTSWRRAGSRAAPTSAERRHAVHLGAVGARAVHRQAHGRYVPAAIGSARSRQP